MIPEREKAIRQRLKNDFVHYSAKCLKIRTKSGKVVQFAMNVAQQHIHACIEEQLAEKGKVRAIILKGRQQGCCLDPNTRVLTADLRWVRIADVVPGTELVSVDDETTSVSPGISGGGRGRKMRTATVEVSVRTQQPCYRITLSDGRELITSSKHRWLVRKSQTQWYWRAIEGSHPDGRDGIKVGDKMRSITTPWDDPALEDYWFGGMIDGEGSMDCSLTRTGIRLAVSQRAGAVLNRMEAHCHERGYGHYIISDDGPRKTKLGQDAVHAVNLSNLGTMFRVMGLSRPARFIGRRWWEGKSMPDNGEVEIVSIESLGIREVVDIQTSTGTFIAEGIVSHNSTYVEGRFYWKVTHAKGMRAFILTHMGEATDNLFELAQRYHDNCPALVRPHTSYSNAKELYFDKLDSGYKVGTAGSKGSGRGSTIQYFHGSEVAFWDNAEAHAAGVLQAVPDEPGTEIIKESTANGLGNYFHKEWQLAESGQSDYIAIFVPWYWQDEYSREVPDDFVLTVEEEKHMEMYELTMQQMVWRRAKIGELGELLFKQEYPVTAAEAFQMSGHDPYIPAQLVVDARSAKAEALGPKKLGVDPARFGDDRTSLCFRQGRKVHWIRSYSKRSTMEVAGLVYKAIKEIGADQCAVDVGGLGAGVYDRLEELMINDPCHLVQVNSSSVPIDEVKYTNKRAEMWGETKTWLETQPADVPDDDELQADLTQIKYSYDSSNRLRMEKKEDMKKRGLRSPDKADSLGLTFAEPVKPPKRRVIKSMPRRPHDPGTGY